MTVVSEDPWHLALSLVKLVLKGLGFRGLGFRGLGFRGLGFRFRVGRAFSYEL